MQLDIPIRELDDKGVTMISFEKFTANLKGWANARGLLSKDPHIQFTKIVEELGEMSAAYNKRKLTKLKDSVGDLFVTIIIFCHQVGLDPQECFNYAWEQIAHRKGKTVNGVFIKEADLKGEKENG